MLCRLLGTWAVPNAQLSECGSPSRRLPPFFCDRNQVHPKSIFSMPMLELSPDGSHRAPTTSAVLDYVWLRVLWQRPLPPPSINKTMYCPCSTSHSDHFLIILSCSRCCSRGYCKLVLLINAYMYVGPANELSPFPSPPKKKTRFSGMRSITSIFTYYQLCVYDTVFLNFTSS
jgi:hypothetical protein